MAPEIISVICLIAMGFSGGFLVGLRLCDHWNESTIKMLCAEIDRVREERQGVREAMTRAATGEADG